MKSVLLLFIAILITGCGSQANRNIASECTDDHPVDREAYFADYEKCKGI